MKGVAIIAINTFREIIRDRILYILLVVGILVTCMSLVLGSLSFSEQIRISANFGLTSIQIVSIALAIFVGGSLVVKEIEKKTILTLLCRPISRLQFLIGKSLGLALVIFVLVLGLATVLMMIFLGLNFPITTSFFVSLWGIYIESLVVLHLALFFSCFTKIFMVISFSVGCFLIGHWISELKFFAERSESEAFKVFADVISYVFPNLELFNWRSAVIYGDSISFSEVFHATYYGFLFSLIFVFLSSFIIRRKDFV